MAFKVIYGFHFDVVGMGWQWHVGAFGYVHDVLCCDISERNIGFPGLDSTRLDDFTNAWTICYAGAVCVC